MESHFYGKTAKLSNGKRVEKKKPAKGGLKVSSSIRLVDELIEGFP
jgi:hypothetical protein